MNARLMRRRETHSATAQIKVLAKVGHRTNERPHGEAPLLYTLVLVLDHIVLDSWPALRLESYQNSCRVHS